jgi:predicted transport protein
MPSPEEMAAHVERRTGRAISEWLELLPEGTFTQQSDFLVSEHGLKPSDARAVLHLGAYLSWPPDAELVAAQYAGAKEALRPIYEAVLTAVTALGDDVAVSPRKTYVSFDRARQFALVQASTRTRVDLGVRLDDATATCRQGIPRRDGGPGADRLAVAGSFGSGNITHRVGLTAPGEVDAEVRGWLRAAYDGAAPA